jgi:hypothetical protein
MFSQLSNLCSANIVFPMTLLGRRTTQLPEKDDHGEWFEIDFKSSLSECEAF